jgi:hypothetical protein
VIAWAASFALAATVADLRGGLASCAGSVTPMPRLDDAQLEALLRGDVVRVLERPPDDRPRRVVAAMLSATPRADLWWAAQDPHFHLLDRLVEAKLRTQQADAHSWYGFLDAPRPVSDRHWVVDSWNHHGLAKASGDRCWEHPWRLAPDGQDLARAAHSEGRIPGVDAATFDAAVWVPTSEGAWFAMDVGEGHTLFVYHTMASMGGAIPDWIVSRYAYSGLEKMMRDIETRAADRTRHYVPGHAPVYDGAGRALPTGPVK